MLASAQTRAENEKLLHLGKYGTEVSDDSGITNKAKLASLVNDDMIFTILREGGFSRRIVEYEQISDANLNTDPDNLYIPTKFVSVEQPIINGYTAAFTDWMQATRDLWYQGEIEKVRMFPIVSRNFRMTENQIKLSPLPIRQYVEGVIRNDFLEVEDERFMYLVENCIASTGQIVNSLNTSLQPSDITQLIQTFARIGVPLSTLLVHEATYAEILNWTQTLVGSQVMADHVYNGLVGEDMKLKAFFGVKWVTTQNSDIVPEGAIYAFGPQNMLGKFYEYGTPETYVKYEHPVLSIKMRTACGQAILNPKAVAKIVF